MQTLVERHSAMIAAAAEQGGLAVLHKDGHFARLAEVLAFDSVSLPIE